MKEDRRERGFFGIPLVFVLLWSAYPALFLYCTNAAELPFSDIAIGLAGSLLIGVLCYSFMLLLTRNNALSGILSFVLVGLFLNFQYVVKLTDRFTVNPRVRVYYLVAALLAVLLIGVILLLHRKWKGKAAGPVCRLGAVALAAILLINFVTAVPGIYRRRTADTFTAGGAAQTDRVLPNLYFIILDEYASFQELEKYYGYDNAGFREFLEKNRFSISDSSYNRAGSTDRNMADTVNLGPVTDASMTIDQYHALLNNGILYGILEGLGYDLWQLGSLYPLPELLTKADFLTRSGVATMNGETALEILITNSMLMPLPTMLYWDRVGGKGEVVALEWLEQPDHYGKENRALFVYLCCPHPPFYYDEDGGEVDRENWVNFSDPKYYLDQLKYVTKMTERAITGILANDPDSIILLQSDHGLRFHNDSDLPHLFHISLMDQFRILNAAYCSGDPLPIEGLSGYNTWRLVLNRLGENYPLLPEEHLFPADD